MVSRKRPAQRATCVIDQLENRTHFAFGDFDQSWGTNGVQRFHVDGGAVDLLGIGLQPSGRVIGLLGSSIEGGYVVKRRTPTGAPDNTFGKNGIGENFQLLDTEPYFVVNADGSYSISSSSYTHHDEESFSITENFDASGHHVVKAPGPETSLNDGTILHSDVLPGITYVLGDNYPTKYRLGSKDSFIFDYGNLPYFDNYHMLMQGPYLVSWKSGSYGYGYSGTPGGICRIDLANRVIDTKFGTNGNATLPFDFSDLEILNDGSFVYLRTSHTGKIVVGHLPADGKADPHANTTWGAKEFVYSTGEKVTGAELLVDKSDHVYVSAKSSVYDSMSSYPLNSYIIKITMPTKAQPKINGKLFNDLNANGRKDPGEKAIAGRTVYLDLNKNGILDRGDRSTLTDIDGNYIFNLVPPGTYNLRRVLPAGYKVTNPLFSKGSITIKNGQTFTANIGSVKI